MSRTITGLLVCLALLVSVPAAFGKATTKSNSKAIAKLKHDVATISQREKQDRSDIDLLLACISAYPADLFILPGAGIDAGGLPIDVLAFGLSDTPTVWIATIDEACLATTQGSTGRAHLHLPS